MKLVSNNISRPLDSLAWALKELANLSDRELAEYAGFFKDKGPTDLLECLVQAEKDIRKFKDSFSKALAASK